MAELTAKERLQPALLDRLTDEAPDRQVESRDERVMSLRRLRQCVLRDLEWLLNTGAMLDPEQAERQPEVARSVLNYGIPPLAGVQASSLNLQRMERLLRDALWAFEPRLLRDSIKVRAVATDAMNHASIAFDIQARLWAQPMPLNLLLRTEIDLESGHVQMREPGKAPEV